LLHGYSLGFKFTFACESLDDKNWVVDFGGLKDLKYWLEDHFDHKLVVDINDPAMDTFEELEVAGLASLTILKGVGCEKFAEHAFLYADEMVRNMTDNRCWVTEVECMEHGANSGVFYA
jgi:6-pyruvoyltetrahydropterin/6-carboxytetrahydropterin synthase